MVYLVRKWKENGRNVALVATRNHARIEGGIGTEVEVGETVTEIRKGSEAEVGLDRERCLRIERGALRGRRGQNPEREKIKMWRRSEILQSE